MPLPGNAATLLQHQRGRSPFGNPQVVREMAWDSLGEHYLLRLRYQTAESEGFEMCNNVMKKFLCRENCGACCIAPSISSPIPGMPEGKPAGISCIHLDSAMRCRIFGQRERPSVCSSLQPSAEMCGKCRKEAMTYLENLERLTAPEK